MFGVKWFIKFLIKQSSSLVVPPPKNAGVEQFRFRHSRSDFEGILGKIFFNNSIKSFSLNNKLAYSQLSLNK